MAKKQRLSKVPQYDSSSLKSELPPEAESALNIATRQVGLLQVQQEKLLEELAFLEITLQDLAASRLDNKNLRLQKDALDGALRKCQEELGRLKGRASE